MNVSDLTPEIKASITAQLTPEFMAACSSSGQKTVLAELVYAKAITNPQVLKAQSDWQLGISMLNTVLMQLSSEVNLEGYWVSFGGMEATKLASATSFGSRYKTYTGAPQFEIGKGHKSVLGCAMWVDAD
ncbi:MAG: hypothetical protein ACJA1C_000821 [Crocinitomicaceae bacterium]|jgi:hypothetical protein